MNTRRLGLVILLFSLPLATGCTAVSERLAMIGDTLRFRRDLGETRRELRRTELETERREMETQRRAELRQMKRDMVQMVPELQASLQTTFKNKVSNISFTPDYEAIAKAAETLAKLEEENERVYQEELAEWLREETEYQRQQAKYAAWRHPLCPIHGRDCNCKQKEEPSCAKPPAPPRAPVREMPKKPSLPKLPVKYKMEFDVEAGVEGWEFVEAQPGRAPVKERCLPEKEARPSQKGLFKRGKHAQLDAETSVNIQDAPIPPKPVAEDNTEDSTEDDGPIIRASLDFRN